jgi:hypothetical protein
MKSLSPQLLLTALLCLPFASCSTPQNLAAAKVQDRGDSFTGTVIESTPERITIKLKDSPHVLVLSGQETVPPAVASR